MNLRAMATTAGVPISPPGEEVWMADGSFRTIEDICVGDVVLPGGMSGKELAHTLNELTKRMRFVLEG